MGIGLSGMISGLDTDSIVKAMVSAQQTKATKIENKITLNKWTTEAWSGLNTKIYSFYTKYASKLRLQSSYMTRTANSSNESVVKATAGTTAAVGSHTLSIKKLASSQYVTSGQLKDSTGKKADYNKNSKLVEIGQETDSEGNVTKSSGLEAGTIITITGKKGTADEKVQKLEVTEETTVNDFLNACKNAGLTATFDTTQQRFFISSSQSGSDDAFSITTSKLSSGATTAFGEIAEEIDTTALSGDEKTAYEQALSTLKQNVGLIGKVLDSKTYDSSDATEKAVNDAIETVKNAAAKTVEKNVSDKAKKDATTAENEEIIKALKEAADASDPDATIVYGSTTLKYGELKTAAEEQVKKNNKAAAEKAGADAIAKVTIHKAAGKSYAELSSVTKEKYDEAKKTISEAKDKDGNAIDIAEADIDADINAKLTAGDITDETAKALKEAYAIKNTWEADIVTIDDATGVETSTGKTVETAYNEAYTAVIKSDTELEDDINAEMQARVKADQKETYEKNIATKTEGLIEDAKTTTAEDIESLKNNLVGKLTDASSAGTEATSSGLSNLGLGEIDGNTAFGSNDTGNTSGMAVVVASDAEFTLDGADMTETSNNFTVNGITLNLVSTTRNKDTGIDEPVQITVGKDTESTYNLVKEALTEYNKLIEEMNTLYNADSARGYDPLTDEQKDAMSDTEIENWETKIKDALLRRDDTLGTLISSMRTALSSTYTDADGKTYSLSTYGIVTGNYTEKGKLHIYGDEDDSTYATYEDRLKTALEEDPDKVMEVLTNVFGKLYETMTEKCAKTDLSSALTFYNDKQYKNLLEDYEDDLEKMQDKIADLEDRYYKQFTSMETALSKLQSQSNSLASLLGTSS